MTDAIKIYSERANEINQDIDKIVNKIRIPFIKHRDDMEIMALFEKYKDDQASRNYIQKYAETEMNIYSSKLGKFSMVLALIALVLSAILAIEPPSQLNPIIKVVYIIILIFLFGWLFYIIFEKNLLKKIIMKIEDYKLNVQYEKEKKQILETEVPEKDLKVKIEKFDLNLSISAQR